MNPALVQSALERDDMSPNHRALRHSPGWVEMRLRSHRPWSSSSNRSRWESTVIFRQSSQIAAAEPDRNDEIDRLQNLIARQEGAVW